MKRKGKCQHFATPTRWQWQCPYVVGILLLSLSILFPSISFIEGVEAADFYSESGNTQPENTQPENTQPENTQSGNIEFQAEVDVQPEIDNTSWQEDGTTRVIVNLIKRNPPLDNMLSGVQSVDASEKQIAQTQELFLEELGQDVQSFYNEVNEELDGISGVQSVAAPTTNIQDVVTFSTMASMAMTVNAVTLSKILKSDKVDSVERDTLYRPTLISSIPKIGADLVWDSGYTGEGGAVAVLDTGIEKTHSALKGRVIEEACFSTTASSYNASTVCPNGNEYQIGKGAGVACDSSVRGCSHGTHVAGIVAASSSSLKGVAKGANIISIQVFSKFKKGDHCPDGDCVLSFRSDQIAALEHVLALHKKGVKIAAVNMSLGGDKYTNTSDCSWRNKSTQEITQKLWDVGIAVVAAAGNNGFKDGIASPACLPPVISVGATDSLDKIAYYSNHVYFLDLLAPGSSIKSSIPGGGIGLKSGTSMAAPHVAGTLALLKSAVPTATVSNILGCLKKAGKLIIDSTRENKPRIQVDAAMECLEPQELKDQDIQVTPKSHYFGNVNIGGSSIAKTFKILNGGDSALYIDEAWISASEFVFSKDDCSDTTLIPSDYCEIVVLFEPNVEGVKQATLSIPSDDPDTPTFKVSLSGQSIAQNPNIAISQQYFNFGLVNISETSKEKTFTVKNTGDYDLQLETLSLSNTTEYIINETSCRQETVVPGGSCLITVTFQPLLEGRRRGDLSIKSNDPDMPIVQVRLRGSGQNIPIVISLSPTDNATDVAVGNNLVLTFSQPVGANLGNIVVHNTSGSVIESIDVTSSQVTGLGTDTITINPSSNFAHNTEHYVLIDDKVFIDDIDSNPYPGINDSTKWTFTTTAVSADSIPPIFGNGYPKVSSISYNRLYLSIQSNENGNAYYVVLPEGAEQPTAQQVKNGKDSTGKLVGLSGQKTLMANGRTRAKIGSLKPSTTYSIFTVAEDESANLNTVVRLEVKTKLGGLTLRAEPTIFSEDAGVSASQGTVYRVGGNITEDLSVKLTSNNTFEANVPSTITIPSGQKSVTFAIAAVDDSEGDGSKRVILKASATDYATAKRRLTVLDNENSSVSAIAESNTPDFMNGFPRAVAISHEQFTLYAKMEKRGIARYIVLANGAPTPTAQQIKLGQDSGGNPVASGKIELSANTQKGVRISGLMPSTIYDVWVVAENAANLMGAVVLKQVTTTSGSSQRIGNRSNDNIGGDSNASQAGIERFYAVMNHICDLYAFSDEGHLYKLDVGTGNMTFVDDICEGQSLLCENLSALSIEDYMTGDDSARKLFDTRVLEEVATLSDELRKTMEMTSRGLVISISDGSPNQLNLIDPDNPQETVGILPYNHVGGNVEGIAWIPGHCLE